MWPGHSAAHIAAHITVKQLHTSPKTKVLQGLEYVMYILPNIHSYICIKIYVLTDSNVHVIIHAHIHTPLYIYVQLIKYVYIYIFICNDI